MTVNGAWFQLTSLTFESGAATARTFNNNGGGISLSTGIYNNSAGNHIFNVPIGVDAGTVAFQANSGNLTFTTSMYLNANTAAFSGSNSISISGVMEGTGGQVTKSGTGILSFSGLNTYSGLTTISDGTLQLNAAGGALNSGNAAAISGGKLQVMQSQTIGDFSMSSGTLQVDAGATLTINGIYNVTGGTIINNGKIVLVGPSAFPGSGATISAMNDLEINRSAGVTLDKSITVSGILTLSNGLLTTGSNTITAAGTISGAGSSYYINGKLAQIFSSTGSKIFPIGKGGNYRPLTFNYTSLTGISTVTVEQTEGLLPGSLPANSVLFNQRYWKIAQSGGSSMQYYVTLDGTGFSPVYAPVMFKGEGSLNTAYAVTTPNYTNSVAFTTFSNFGLGDMSVPTAYNVTGSGSYCSGGSGLPVGVNNSETGVTYELWKNNIATGIILPGSNGNAINFGNQTAGTYTVKATNPAGTTDLTGSAIINMNTESAYSAGTIMGASEVTEGNSGVAYNIPPITNANSYEWTYSGTGVIIHQNDYNVTLDFAIGATGGELSVRGENACGFGTPSNISITVNLATPAVFHVTSGGSYCENLVSGVEVGIDNSQTDVEYQLYKDNIAYGSTVTGTGAALPLGIHTAGTYTVKGTNAHGTTDMAGDAVITSYSPPLTPTPIQGPTEVSEGMTDIGYSVSLDLTASDYFWECSSPDVTINVAGPSVNLDFASGLGGTSVTLSVHTSNDCGISGTTSLIISVSSAPDESTYSDTGNWLNLDNWSNGLPGPVTNVIVTGNLTIDEPAQMNDFRIAPGGSVTVGLNNNVIFNGNFLIESDASGTGSFIARAGDIEIGGTTTVQCYFSGNTSDWHLVSSPVSDATADVFLHMYLQQFNPLPSEPSPPDPVIWYTDITEASTPLTVMEGYGLYSSLNNSNTVSFTGNLNSGYQSHVFDLNSVNSDYGWNLLGNPYPSSIDWESVVIPANMSNEVHFINASDGNDIVYVQDLSGQTVSQYIPPMQGFFVSVTGPGTLSLDNGQRSHSGTSGIYKSDNPNMIVLQADGAKYSDQTLIHFNEQAGVEHDGKYDAYKVISATNPDLPQIFSYTPLDVKLAVNGMPHANEVPVGFTAMNSGTFTIRAPKTGDISAVLLEDLLTGIKTDLLTRNYVFNYTAGENEKRFLLHFGPLEVNEAENQLAAIYSDHRAVYIEMKDNVKGDVYIYSIAGQLVASAPLSQGLNKLNLSNTGNYIVKVVTNQNAIVKKVWIQ